MGVTVTIYNDDEFGRDIQVVQINPFGGATYPTIVQQASENGEQHMHSYKLKNGELLIIATAEKE